MRTEVWLTIEGKVDGDFYLLLEGNWIWYYKKFRIGSRIKGSWVFGDELYKGREENGTIRD